MAKSSTGQPCVMYNEDNAVVQCHRCGHVYTPASKLEYANYGSGTEVDVEDGEDLPSKDPEIVNDGILRIRTCIVEAIESARSDYKQALTDGFYTEKSEGCRDLINSYKTMLFHIDAIISECSRSCHLSFSRQILGDSGGRRLAKSIQGAFMSERMDIVSFIMNPPGRISSQLRNSLDELAKAIKSGAHVGWNNEPK